MFPVKESTFEAGALFKISDSDALSSTMTFLNKLGLSPLLSIGAGADDKDPDSVVVQVSPARRIGLPAKDYYKDEKVVKRYTDTIASIIENLHPDDTKLSNFGKFASKANATEHAQDLVRFESILAAASPDAEDADDVTVSGRS